MRLGMIGAGYMAGLHAAAWTRIPGVDVTAIAASHPETASGLAELFGARAETDLRRVLDDSTIDAVDVTTPTATHPAVVLAALDAGKHVFCETPLARTSADAEAMAERARLRGRHLQVALLHRFAVQSLQVREVLGSGRLGNVRWISARRWAPGTGSAHHGDAIEELMLFDLDFLVWTFGEATSARGAAHADAAGRIQHAAAFLEFGAVRATAEATFLLPRSHPFTTELFATCDRGAVEAVFRAPRAGRPTVRCAEYPADGEPRVSENLGEDPIVGECQRFADVVRGETDPALLDASNAVVALRVADLIRASLAAGSSA